METPENEIFRDSISTVTAEGKRAWIFPKKPDPADFSNQHLIIHSFPLETVSVYHHFLRVHQVDPLKITAIPMTEVALELIESNMGISCHSKWALKVFNLPDCLKFIPLGRNGLKRKHYLAIRAEDRDKQYIQDFVDNIKEDSSLTAFKS